MIFGRRTNTWEGVDKSLNQVSFGRRSTTWEGEIHELGSSDQVDLPQYHAHLKAAILCFRINTTVDIAIALLGSVW